MTKRELEEKVRQLEARIAQIEVRPVTPTPTGYVPWQSDNPNAPYYRPRETYWRSHWVYDYRVGLGNTTSG